jgi:hypothetical protein
MFEITHHPYMTKLAVGNDSGWYWRYTGSFAIWHGPYTTYTGARADARESITLQAAA